jgi:IclR family transcriptional regulator, KDG regulon repressor
MRRASSAQQSLASLAFSSDNRRGFCYREAVAFRGHSDMKLSSRCSYSIVAVQRCLQLLRLFGQAPTGLMATEVAKLSGLPTSTVYRFLANLETAGFLTCSASGRYYLDIASFSIGPTALSHLDIRRLSLPYLKALNKHTRETIHLLVRQGLSAVYVEKLESPQLPNTISRIGISVPLYCTAVGKVLLAYLPAEDLTRVLRQIEPRCHTPHTIRNTQDLQRQLKRVRKCGYSFDLEENEPHIRCVAAPIWDHAGTVNASLSVSGPAKRMPATRMRELAPVVQEAGIRISRELGYQGSVEPEEDWETYGQPRASRSSQKATLGETIQSRAS